jgi:2-iminobutanoate/2-iminopropanoate deaminase
VKREIIRVEPLSTYLENWKAPTSAVTRSGDTVYVSGFPPFDPDTGKVIEAPIERQTELVLEQMKLCLETAGSSLENVLKCNVYCTSVEKFAAVNAIYARYFPKDPPARIFVCVPAWPGPFDIAIDCIATRRCVAAARSSMRARLPLRSNHRLNERKGHLCFQCYLKSIRQMVGARAPSFGPRRLGCIRRRTNAGRHRLARVVTGPPLQPVGMWSHCTTVRGFASFLWLETTACSNVVRHRNTTPTLAGPEVPPVTIDDAQNDSKQGCCGGPKRD